MAIVGVAGLTAILLYCMATYGNIWLAYVGYCLVRVSYQVLMTVASFEIVKYLPEDAFALIFGINTFAAVGVQSLLSLIVNTILGKKISELKVKSLELTLFHAGFLRYCPPLVSQLWDPKNSKTQFSQTDMVLSFHLSS